MVAQTEPSGAVLAEYDDSTRQPVPGNYSKYFTGEAYWALARVHRLFPDEGWGEAAASATTSPPAATRWRTTGRPFLTTGRRTALQRPSPSRSTIPPGR